MSTHDIPGEASLIDHAGIPTARVAGEGAAGSSPQASTLPAAQIPADVMEAARKAWRAQNFDADEPELHAVCLAILAERERCIAVALNEPSTVPFLTGDYAHGFWVACQDVAHMIRKGGTP